MNTLTTPRTRSRTRASYLRVVHRVAGLCAALPVVLLVVTGLPLQFTDAFQLGSRGVPFRMVHAAYGIQAPTEALADGAVVQLGGRLLVAQRNLSSTGTFIGALDFDELWVVATDQSLVLVPKQSSVPDESLTFPGRVSRLGRTAQGAIAIEAEGRLLTSQDFGVSWSAHASGDRIDWRAPAAIPVTDSLSQRYGAAHLSWERWLQDLHSGRFFGGVGEWIMNLAGLVLLLLALSGSVVWWRSRRQ